MKNISEKLAEKWEWKLRTEESKGEEWREGPAADLTCVISTTHTSDKRSITLAQKLKQPNVHFVKHSVNFGQIRKFL